MCCTRLAGNTARKKAQNSRLCVIAQLCRAISSQLRHISTTGIKLLNSSTSSRFRHNMVNFGPLTAENGWRVWGTLANFNVFRVFSSLLQRRRSLEANQTLHDVWPSPGLIRCTSSGALAPWRNLPGAKFTLRPNLAFSYIGSVNARHSSSERQPKFAACYKEWNYRTFAEGATYIRLGGHHVGHRPTF